MTVPVARASANSSPSDPPKSRSDPSGGESRDMPVGMDGLITPQSPSDVGVLPAGTTL